MVVRAGRTLGYKKKRLKKSVKKFKNSKNFVSMLKKWWNPILKLTPIIASNLNGSCIANPNPPGSTGLQRFPQPVNNYLSFPSRSVEANELLHLKDFGINLNSL